MRPGNWLTTIDLRDAYFHIPIYHSTENSSGLPSRALLACIRHICLAMHIDDSLLAAQSPQQTLALTRLLSSHLVALGFTLNWEKSVLILTQTIRFIGLSLYSLAFRVCLRRE